MGTKYSTNTVSGYNATPPADDGTVSEANKVKWSTVKTKLSDPINTLAATINSELVTHFDNGPTALTSNTTLGASHYNQVIEVSSSGVTLTLTDAGTLGAGWFCHIINTDSSNAVTITGATTADTWNGTAFSASTYSLKAGFSLMVTVNAAESGFLFSYESLIVPRSGTTGTLLTYAPGGESITTSVINDHIQGMIPSLDTDTDHDILISAGQATDSSNAAILVGNAYTKQIDAGDFATGDDAAGMAPVSTLTGTFSSTGTAVTGTSSLFTSELAVGDVLYSSTEAEARRITAIASDTGLTIESAFTSDVTSDNVQKNGLAPSTTYYIHLIENSTTDATDYYFDVSSTAANIPSGYSKYRNVGQFDTDATDPANIDSATLRRASLSRSLIDNDLAFGWREISRTTVSGSVATVDLTWSTGEFDFVELEIVYLRFAGDSQLDIQVSTDGGSTWVTSGYDYGSSTAQTSWVLTSAAADMGDADVNISGTFRLRYPDNGVQIDPYATWDIIYQGNVSGTSDREADGGRVNGVSTSTFTGLRLDGTSQNIDEAYLILRGYRNV